MKKNLNRLVSLALALVLALSALSTVQTTYAATYTTIANGTYTIASKANENYLLDVYGNTTVNTSNVQLYKKSSTAPSTQRFKFTLTTGGWYSISPCSNTSLAVNAYSSSPTVNTNVNVYTKNSKDPTQGFYLQEVNGYYLIRLASKPSLCLTVVGTAKNMANVRLETYTGKDAQLWKLSKVSDTQTVSLVFPVNNGMKIAYYYGNTSEYGSTHSGLDIHSTGDDNIYAAAAGRVIAVSNSCPHVNYGGKCAHWTTYGNMVKIQGDDGRIYIYGHLKQNSIQVKVGDTVRAGQRIATMGSSGYSTGKHLHFEVRSSNGSTTLNVNPATGSYKYKGSTFTYTNGPYSK